MLWCRLLKSPRRANTMFPKQSNLNWQFIGHLSSEGKAFREVMRRERRRAEEKKHLSVVIPPLVFVLFWFARFQTFWSQPTTKWLLRDCRFILTPPTLPRKVQNFHRVIVGGTCMGCSLPDFPPCLFWLLGETNGWSSTLEKVSIVHIFRHHCPQYFKCCAKPSSSS